jgi:cytochrome d ubiquinol oxidase subunit II
VPLLTAFTAYRLYRALEDGRHVAPFLLAIGLFLLGFLGLAVSLFPYIVPPRFTIWQASNTPDSQAFALVGYAVVMPLTFIYTAYAYYVFRGKVAEDVQSSGDH